MSDHPEYRAGIENGTLSTHAWLYDLHHGKLLAYDRAADRWEGVAALP